MLICCWTGLTCRDLLLGLEESDGKLDSSCFALRCESCLGLDLPDEGAMFLHEYDAS